MRGGTSYLRKWTALFLAVLMVFTLMPESVMAAETTTATTITLKKTEGTVAVNNSGGRKLSMPQNMKLYNGYHVITKDKSYAWMELDSTKLTKLDATSELELRKNKKALELLVKSGNLFFNVTKPLEDDETLNIHTSTMVAGIRGTSGWVRMIDEKCSRVYILEGSVICSVTDPISGQTKRTTLKGGEWADFYVYEPTQEGDKCDIVRQEYGRDDVPGFVLAELLGDTPLCEEIFEESGIDFRDLTEEEVRKRLEEDQKKAAEELEKVGKATIGQKDTTPVWTDQGDGSGSDNGGNSGGTGGGSSGGSSGAGSGGSSGGSSTTQDTYTVSFDSNGGTSVSSQTVASGGTVRRPSDPTRSGYSFGGWFTTAGCVAGSEWSFAAGTVTRNITLYAKWTASGYTVSFSTGRGSSVASQTVEVGGKVTRPANPTREGYTFAGWWTTAAEGTGAEWDFSNGIVSDLTLYARWTINSYTVTFDLNGGTGTAVASQTINYGEKVTQPADPSMDPVLGNFGGWYKSAAVADGTEWDFTTDTVTENITLYAKWTGAGYTVKFSTNGGSSVSSQVVTAGDYATEPTEPTKTGYTFGGWYTTDTFDAGTEWDFAADAVTGNVTLYAKWTASVSYIVSFDSNGGSSVASQTVEPGEKVAKPTNPTLIDYAFGGWYTTSTFDAGTEWDFAEDTVTKNITLYAKWIHATEDYLVTGGILGTDYKYEDGVVTILSNVPMKIQSVDPNTPSTDSIIVTSTSGANLTLDGVNICTDSTFRGAGRSMLGASPFLLGAPAATPAMQIGAGTGDVTITLASGSENRLISKTTAILHEGSGKVTIKGDGKLEAINSSGSYGSYAIQCADLVIEGSDVYAEGYNGGVKCSGEVSATDSILYSVSSANSGKISAGSKNFSSSIVFDMNEGQVYGAFTLKRDLAISQKQVLKIPDGAALTLASDVTLKNDGGVAVETGGTLNRAAGSLDNNFWLLESGKMTVAAEGEIEDRTWYGFSSQIIELEIEDSVTGLPNYAFERCSNLTSVSLSKNLTGIADYAFQSCSKLTEVELPPNLTTIGTAAFDYCSNLTSLNVPESVTIIGESAFTDCDSLTSMVVPEQITELRKGLFQNCDKLETVTIKGEVESIGESVFNGCKLLSSVNIPNNVTSIGNSAFKSCEKLGSLTIPGGVTSIGNSAFSGCTILDGVKLPEGLTLIGDSLFLNCANLSGLTIPDGVSSIGSSAFSGCANLSGLTIPSGVTSIGSSAFSGCRKLGGMVIPESTKTIGNSAFLNCVGMASLTLPEGLESVGSQAFKGCTGLTSLAVPSTITTMGKEAFASCTGVETLTLPEGLKLIGESAFSDMKKVTSLAIPSTVSEIGDSAFYNCAGLTSVDIPEGVAKIGEAAFYSCKELKAVTIPSSVTRIGARAFSGCAGLATLTLNEGLLVIGEYAFGYEITKAPALTSLNGDLVIPSTVTEIGKNAFYGAENLHSVSIPDTTKVGEYAFFGCKSLVSANIPAGMTEIPKDLFSNCTALTSIVIPDGVTSIGNYAFSSSGLTSVTIPATVTSIEIGAFSGTALTEAVIPDTVTSLGATVFSDCGDLVSVTVGNGVGSIGQNAFRKCAKLEKVTLGSGVKSIGVSAFEMCGSLVEINIPDGVTSIGDQALSSCGSLKTIVIPDSVTTFGRSIFTYDHELKHVTLGSGMTSIPNSMFSYVHGKIEKLIIPVSITSVGSEAFRNTDGGIVSIGEIRYGGTTEEWNNSNLSNERAFKYATEIYDVDGNVIPK